MGLPALESTGKFTSNGSLLSQNGIKYSSEPELQKKEQRGSLTYPDTDGYRNFREGGKYSLTYPDTDGYRKFREGGKDSLTYPDTDGYRKFTSLLFW